MRQTSRSQDQLDADTPARAAPDPSSAAGRGQRQVDATLRTDAARSSTGMPSDLLHKMERSFGADFSDVRIHADSAKASAVGAEAFAQGNDVHFAPGRFDPHREESQALLGHELAHVVQQRDGRVGDGPQAKRSAHGSINDDHGLESEADAAGAKAARGELAPETARSQGGTRASGEAPMQLYTKVTSTQNPQFGGGTWRVADDGRMAVEDSSPGNELRHKMWAAAEVIARSKATLGQIGSPYTVATGGGQITIDAPDGSGQVDLQEVTITNTSNDTTTDHTTDELLTKENCDANTGNFLGQDSRVFDYGMTLKDGTFIDKKQTADPTKDVRDQLTGKTGIESKRAYDKLSYEKRHALDDQLGVNSKAAPITGQGITVYQGGAKHKDGSAGFGFHFAPVLAHSGSDYVTLENHGRGNRSDDSKATSAEWYLRMYGPVKESKGRFGRKKIEDQSFHHEQEQSGQMGKRVITMVVDGREPQSADECDRCIVDQVTMVARTFHRNDNLLMESVRRIEGVKELTAELGKYVEELGDDADPIALLEAWQAAIADANHKVKPSSEGGSDVAVRVLEKATGTIARALTKVHWLGAKRATF